MVATYVTNKTLRVARAPGAYALFKQDVTCTGVNLPLRQRLREKTGVRSGAAIHSKWSGPELAEATVINQSCARKRGEERQGSKR
jgi:hypothetical protein